MSLTAKFPEEEPQQPEDKEIDWTNLTPEEVMAAIQQQDKIKAERLAKEAARLAEDFKQFEDDPVVPDPDVTSADSLTLEQFIDQLIDLLEKGLKITGIPDNIQQYCKSMLIFMRKETMKIHTKKGWKDRL